MAQTMKQQNIFQDDLLTGEELLWTGQPDPSVNFNRSDIFLVPFTFLWAGFAFFAFFSAWIHPSAKNSPIAFLIPFLAIGLYVTIGRFIFKKIKKRHTYYAVTNRRILVFTTLFGKNLQNEYINTLAAISKSIRSSGIGNIIFGNNSSRWAIYANSGLDFFGNFSVFGGSIAPSFYDVKDANKVYKLIADLRNTQINKI
jgi:hypothetical protein